MKGSEYGRGQYPAAETARYPAEANISRVAGIPTNSSSNDMIGDKPTPTQAVLSQLRNIRGTNFRMMDMLEGVTKRMTGVAVLPPPAPTQAVQEGLPFFEAADMLMSEIRGQQENLLALAEHLERI